MSEVGAHVNVASSTSTTTAATTTTTTPTITTATASDTTSTTNPSSEQTRDGVDNDNTLTSNASTTNNNNNNSDSSKKSDSAAPSAQPGSITEPIGTTNNSNSSSDNSISQDNNHAIGHNLSSGISNGDGNLNSDYNRTNSGDNHYSVNNNNNNSYESIGYNPKSNNVTGISGSAPMFQPPPPSQQQPPHHMNHGQMHGGSPRPYSQQHQSQQHVSHSHHMQQPQHHVGQHPHHHTMHHHPHHQMHHHQHHPSQSHSAHHHYQQPQQQHHVPHMQHQQGLHHPMHHQMHHQHPHQHQMHHQQQHQQHPQAPPHHHHHHHHSYQQHHEVLSKTNLYIKGLEHNTCDDDLFELCSRFGQIVSTKAILDKNTNRCKGYGFVDFESPASADKAVAELQRQGIMAQMAKVQQESDPTNLYIANLPPTMTEEDLEALLSPYGVVVSTRILKDQNDRPRGVGFARMETKDQCEHIISQMHGRALKGCKEVLLVKFADGPKKVRQHPFQHQQHHFM